MDTANSSSQVTLELMDVPATATAIDEDETEEEEEEELELEMPRIDSPPPLTYAPRKKKSGKNAEFWRRWRKQMARHNLPRPREVEKIITPNSFAIPDLGRLPRHFKLDEGLEEANHCKMHNKIYCDAYQLGFRVKDVGSLVCLHFRSALSLTKVQAWFCSLARVYYDLMKRPDVSGNFTLQAHWARRIFADETMVVPRSTLAQINDLVDWFATSIVFTDCYHLTTDSPVQGGQDRAPYMFSTWNALNQSPLTELQIMDTGSQLPLGGRWQHVEVGRLSLFKCDTILAEYDLVGHNTCT